MKFRNLFLAMFVLLSAALSFTACSDNDNDGVEVADGIYVLNNGKEGSNNSTITYYNPETKKANIEDVYKAMNGKQLGDCGQDIIVYKDRIYMTVYKSNRISVMTEDFTETASISLTRDGQPQSPRYMAEYDGKIYVTLFDGYVGQLNTKTNVIEKQVKVGRNPEQLVVSNGKLFVANSGGMDFPNYDKTVSVIDLKSFAAVDTAIEVIINPTRMAVDDKGTVYCISMGDYTMTTPNTLQKIDPKTYEVTTIGNATRMACSGKMLYWFYAQWGAPAIEFKKYDTDQQKIVSDKFVANWDSPIDPYSISYIKEYDYVCIGVSDYTNNGDIYIYNTEGVFVNKFETGLNPEKAIYVD